MTAKSLVDEMRQVQMAIELIELGARLQVLETETDLSRSRLVKLYKEVRGMSPPKGMLPFSTDWFITWAKAWTPSTWIASATKPDTAARTTAVRGSPPPTDPSAEGTGVAGPSDGVALRARAIAPAAATSARPIPTP